MAEQIRDGTGKGFLAKVDSENRLLVHADQNSEEHNISHAFARAYIANTADTAPTLTVSNGETINLLYAENSDPDRIINVHDMRVTTDTAGIVVQIIRNPVLGTVGANNAHTPQNLNFQSEQAASGVFHNWDESGTAGITGITGGTVLESHNLRGSNTVFLYESAVLLFQGNSVVMRVINNTGGDVEVAATFRFYYEDV